MDGQTKEYYGYGVQDNIRKKDKIQSTKMKCLHKGLHRNA